MTINEKIDAFVLAQGNQVGAGAELAELLNEIVDAAVPKGIKIELPNDFSGVTLSEAAKNLSISEQEVKNLYNGKYDHIELDNHILYRVTNSDYGGLIGGDYGFAVHFSKSADGTSYSAFYYEA